RASLSPEGVIRWYVPHVGSTVRLCCRFGGSVDGLCSLAPARTFWQVSRVYSKPEISRRSEVPPELSLSAYVSTTARDFLCCRRFAHTCGRCRVCPASDRFRVAGYAHTIPLPRPSATLRAR